MGKTESIDSLNDLFVNKRRQAIELCDKYEELDQEDGPVRSDGLRRKLVRLELELRQIRRQVLEAYHAQLPMFARWRSPRYWEVACPIKLNYAVCGHLTWYDHISGQWYETEEQALIGAYNRLRANFKNDPNVKIKPLEQCVKQLLKEGFTDPDQGLADISMQSEPAALPAPH